MLARTFFISLSLHTVILLAVYFYHNPFLMTRPVQKQIRVAYRTIQAKSSVDVGQRPIEPAQKLDLRSKTANPGAVGIQLMHLNTKSEYSALVVGDIKPRITRTVERSHRVTISPEVSASMNNPAYAKYNEMVRSRIEEKIYEYYDRSDIGRVYLTFVVGTDGTLQGAQILQDKTNGSKKLQDISLSSLKAAAPFPDFIKGMSLEAYSFNIEIQYQIDGQ